MKHWFKNRRDDADDSGFVLLARFPEMWQADLAISLLASEGIEAWPADELSINGTDYLADMDGVGVVVHEGDAMPAWHILQMAERGDLALRDDHAQHHDEWNRRKDADRMRASRADGPQSGPHMTDTGPYPDVRCPRCGSENTEKRKGIKSLFSPGRRCRVCRWQWKGSAEY